MNLLIYVGRVDWCFRRLSNYADGMLWDDDENKHHWIERENPTGFTLVLPSNLPSNRCFSGVCYGHEIPLESIRHVSPAQVSGHGCAFVGDVISTIAGGAAAWTKNCPQPAILRSPQPSVQKISKVIYRYLWI